MILFGLALVRELLSNNLLFDSQLYADKTLALRSCTQIKHSRCALVIWSALQLTSKQWIFTQQLTARADLFLFFFF